MTVLELSHVTKRFGDFTAVADVSLTVDKGQILSLPGPRGCGKTTTLRMVSGFEEPNEGDIFIAGQDMKGKRPYERNVGLLFQDYALCPHMTVVQNVGYGLKNRGYERSRIPARIDEMLELVKLTGFENRRPAQLSGGQQQRVALARALAWRRPGRWRSARRWCCSTSRGRRSTPSSGRSCGWSSRRSCRPSAPRPSS